VPLHRWRRMHRGFNQARDLARQLDRPVADALWRIRATPPQMSLDRFARRTNLHAAFIMSPFCGGNPLARLGGADLLAPLRGADLPGPRIRDRVIVLVDDVRTTGSTLSACAKVLVDAGAREVRALTAACVPSSG